MATDSSSLKKLLFSGESEGFPTWSTRFIAFMRTKGLHKILIGNEKNVQKARQFSRKPI